MCSCCSLILFFFNASFELAGFKARKRESRSTNLMLINRVVVVILIVLCI